ncbi:MAG: acetyltransferase [SAR324 cluster bacterium]|nr:acetyltransferase [SAR324 cluster bacterium]MBF0351787.1 acetyltransferase [SAR324 cluster bacterium]
MKKSLILVGGGGHCHSCIDVIEQEDKFTIAGILDIPSRLGETVLGYSIIGQDEQIPELVKQGYSFLITIGHIKTPNPRQNLYKMLKRLKAPLPVIISPRAYVSPHASVGEGSIVMHGSVVNAGSKVGCNCILNSKSLIEHDALISDHCHISTGAIVNGGTCIGEGTFLGSNSVTREYITVGQNCLIGGGMSIMRNIPDGTLLKPPQTGDT